MPLLRIVYVEPDEHERNSLADLLEYESFAVFRAATIDHAIEFINHDTEVHLLLIGIDTSSVNGDSHKYVDFVCAVNYEEIPKAIITAYAGREDFINDMLMQRLDNHPSVLGFIYKQDPDRLTKITTLLRR